MRFEYWMSARNGQWYFHRKHRNGKVTGPSEGYSTESNVRKAIRAEKLNALRSVFAKVIEIRKGNHN